MDLCVFIYIVQKCFLRHSLKIAVKMFKTLDNLKQFDVRRRSRHIYVLSILTKGRILNTVAMLFTICFIFYVPNNCILPSTCSTQLNCLFSFQCKSQREGGRCSKLATSSRLRPPGPGHHIPAP